LLPFILEHFSPLAGNMGMKIATKQMLELQAARTSLPQAFLGGGTVMGLGLGLVLGLTTFYIFLHFF
jgi:Na+/H+-translocating membrane pyrophosphatase